MPTHPIQPLYRDKSGTMRFLDNRIVCDLYEFAKERGFGLNEIAQKDYSKEDRQQFAQLIGYSLSGYAELRSYVDAAAYEVAEAKAVRPKKSDAEIERDYLRRELEALRASLQKPMARLFGVYPDDLKPE